MHTIQTQSLPQLSRFASIGLLAISSMLQAQPQHFKQTNLVSDIPGMAAATDPNLVNPWGITRSSSSPWWVSDNGPGLATLYSGTGSAVSLVVTIPAGPTNYLYVADFRKGNINVYDTNFHLISMDGDAFEDHRVPHGFAPFNVQNIGGNLYVAFAEQDSAKHDEVDGAGLGFVDVFSPTGRLLHRLQWGKWFNAPWGMAQAPSDFGIYSHDILVGQFGSGQILVFDPVTGDFKGSLLDTSNAPISINGLWGIGFGSGGTSGSATTLYFAAGLNDEQDGLFGTITPVENIFGGDH